MTTLEPADLALIRALFKLLKKGSATKFPEPRFLAEVLSKLTPSGETAVLVKADVAKAFATAAVDSWLRAVHSFLVSAALTNSSPIWASVSGYYSSHYVMRATSHLLGQFLLFKTKRVVELSLEDGRYYCTFRRKKNNDREHVGYWKAVKSRSPFSKDALYVLNGEEVDAGHRDFANYADHLSAYYPEFNPISALEMKERVDKISKMSFAKPPSPRAREFPDLENVQIVAYHRLVQFRRMLDEALPGDDRFWTANRKPPFAEKYLSYQLVAGPGMAQPQAN